MTASRTNRPPPGVSASARTVNTASRDGSQYRSICASSSSSSIASKGSPVGVGRQKALDHLGRDPGQRLEHRLRGTGGIEPVGDGMHRDMRPDAPIELLGHAQHAHQLGFVDERPIGGAIGEADRDIGRILGAERQGIVVRVAEVADPLGQGLGGFGLELERPEQAGEQLERALVEVDLAVLVADRDLHLALAEGKAVDPAIGPPRAVGVELEQAQRGTLHAAVGERLGLGVLQLVAGEPRLGPARRRRSSRP